MEILKIILAVGILLVLFDTFSVILILINLGSDRAFWETLDEQCRVKDEEIKKETELALKDYATDRNKFLFNQAFWLLKYCAYENPDRTKVLEFLRELGSIDVKDTEN